MSDERPKVSLSDVIMSNPVWPVNDVEGWQVSPRTWVEDRVREYSAAIGWPDFDHANQPGHLCTPTDCMARACVALEERRTSALEAELAGAKATIEHQCAGMSWIAGHDRQGLDHLQESIDATARAEAAEAEVAWVRGLRDELDEMLRARNGEVHQRDDTLARVRALHVARGPLADWCEECAQDWPCQTARAMRGGRDE